MKKFMLLVLATFLVAVIPFPEKKVRADSPYLRVINEQTAFYSNTFSETPLFYLPYTYYVRVIGETDEYYHVEYGGEKNSISIDGYVKKDCLYKDELSADYRYPNVKITTSFNTVLYLDSNLSNYSQYIFSGRELNYYGSFNSPDGATIFFVSYNQRLGYVKECDVSPFSIENHPNPLTFIPAPEPEVVPPEKTPEPDVEPTPTTDNTMALKIAIILSILFAGLFGLFVALKNKTSPSKTSSYYDENEFE